MEVPAEAFTRVLGVLDQLEIPYLVGGSVASSIHGITWPTLDADLVAAIHWKHVDEFARLLERDFYADPFMMREALRQGRSFNCDTSSDDVQSGHISASA